MLRTGICSVTFRRLDPRQVVEAAKRAGLEGIEWGGDLHAPHGQTELALEVRRLTEEAGLRVASYGSYYRVGSQADNNPDFADVLASAKALGAPIIRVWAGDLGSAEMDEATVGLLTADARRISAEAETEGIRIAFEYHNHTMTDTLESTWRMLQLIDRPAVRSYWQASGERTAEEQLQAIRTLLPRLSNVHVSYSEVGRRMPLSQGAAVWTSYIRELAQSPQDRYLLLEFVQDDDVEQMMQDAAELKRMVNEIS